MYFYLCGCACTVICNITSCFKIVCANTYNLKARCNVADNSAGTATQVEIQVDLADNYVDPGAPPPGDLVDGTLTITADKIQAAGTMQPTGTFAVNGPSSVTMSAISLA